MSIRTLILIIINSLIAFVIVVLAFSSYKEFSNVLNDRILQQLNSIKTLVKLPDSIKKTNGIHDFTPYQVNKKTTIGFVLNTKRGTKIKILDYNKIKKILFERTGMGNSGESYLVGEDCRLRSQSRFYPSTIPYTLKCRQCIPR